MTNPEVTALYQDARFRQRIKDLSRKYFQGNRKLWRQGTGETGPMFEPEDLEQTAWTWFLRPSLRPPVDSRGEPIQNYLVTAAENYFKSLLKVAKARFAKLPETDYGAARVRVSDQTGPGQYAKLDVLLYGDSKEDDFDS